METLQGPSRWRAYTLLRSAWSSGRLILVASLLCLTLALFAQDAAKQTPPQVQPSSDTVSAAIERVRHSRHDSMPEPKCSLGDGGTSLTVENGTKLPIRYLLNGSKIQDLTLEPSHSMRINLAPGRYQVAAEIPNSRILPFYGEQSFDTGMQCQQAFYMSEGAAAKKNAGETQSGIPEYTTQSLYLKIAQWSRDAVGYDRHRWQKSRMDLLDAVLGSTLKISRLKLDATGLKVGAGGTTYSQIYSLSELGIAQLKGKCRSSQSYDLKLDHARMMRFDDRLRIALQEDSDRLSLELSGVSRVNITGRVMDAAVCSPEKILEPGFWRDHASPQIGVRLSIKITSWSKAE